MDPDSARRWLLQVAGEHRFSHIQLAPIQPTPHFEKFAHWLEAGHHADMDWLQNASEVRADPRHRSPSTQTVIVLGIDHHHRVPPDPGGRTGQVARYAWGRDYHNLVGKRLEKLKKQLRLAGISCWGGVDTAPILERAWASVAGLGFIGKNAVAIWPGRGSWMFLAVLFVDLVATPDQPLKDFCGRCSRCLHSCPTDAFVGPRQLDARRCIAYWTIEASGLPPPELRTKFGRWLLGCDVCQEVCPHNHLPPDPDEVDLEPRNAWIDLDELLMTSDAKLNERFLGTPLRRPGAHGLKRNALLILGNLGDRDGIPAARLGLEHPTATVRAAAVWALRRLGERLSLQDDAFEVQQELAAPME